MKNAIITGPTGMIGVALVEYLLKQGINVYAVVRPNSRNIGRLPDDSRLNIVYGNLLDLDTVTLPVFCESAFFHLGWEGADKSKRDNVELQLENIKSTIAAVKLSAKSKCGSFVFAGSQAEYGHVDGIITPTTPCKPDTAYGVAKLASEQLSRLECSNLNISHYAARIFSIYGRYDGENTLINYLIRSFKRGEKPSLTACEQDWNYLYAKDAAKALFLIAEKGNEGGIYNVASSDNRKLKSYVEEMKRFIGTDIDVNYGGMIQSNIYEINLKVDNSSLLNLGFEVEYSFEDGINDMIK